MAYQRSAFPCVNCSCQCFLARNGTSKVVVCSSTSPQNLHLLQVGVTAAGALQVLAQWAAQYGTIFKWNLVGKTLLVITDPEEVYKLCSREVNLDKPRLLYSGINTVSMCSSNVHNQAATVCNFVLTTSPGNSPVSALPHVSTAARHKEPG